MVGPGLRGFVVGFDACGAFVVDAIAVQESQLEIVVWQDESWIGDFFFVRAGHRQFVSPGGDVAWFAGPAIAQLGGVVVVADVQVPLPINPEADAVMGIAQVVFAGDIVGF